MFMTMGWLLAALLITLLLVRGAIAYAHRRGMLDQPGQRRSHSTPTPRGGGIGIVVAMLICLPGALWSLPAAWPVSVIASLLGALLLVALAGWWDDHRPLPVLPRLGAQLLAVLWFSFTLMATGLSWWWLPLLLGAGTWSINLHNFMDGIDGLLAQQAIFVASGLAWMAWVAAQPALAVATGSLAAASLGFWFFNRPAAQIFMGDVGSGSIGLLIFAFTAMLWRVEPALLWPALILSSAFVVDASLTLLTRMLRGRRWHTAHREHLYQWLVRSDRTHAQADVAYLAWNLLIAAPLTWLAYSHLQIALPITIVVYLIAAAAWLALKRRCLRRNLPGGRHVAA
ncbi:glycosyltransferase family 4 protein [Rhodanobacter sp. MP7CTX1]|uniref:MraY family glycosyltransferase n=1 Tax=Rhodanobacter sp. MP7CTX1 TaxID=2723084 RepID=UPI001609FA16|nr:glycosyltransferase family 4 protein [Rhodanobacter sp. MP7CTX1]